MAPVWLWTPLVAWMGLIFLGSSMPIGDNVGFLAIPHADKIFHTAEYAVLGLLIARLLGRRSAPAPLRTVAFTAALTLCYGVTDEIHQLFVATRQFDVVDMTADLTGGLIGGGLWFLGLRLPRLPHWW